MMLPAGHNSQSFESVVLLIEFVFLKLSVFYIEYAVCVCAFHIDILGFCGLVLGLS